MVRKTIFLRPLETSFALLRTKFVQYAPNGNVNNFILITKHAWMKRRTMFSKGLNRGTEFNAQQK
jgi:hypothetical protein